MNDRTPGDHPAETRVPQRWWTLTIRDGAESPTGEPAIDIQGATREGLYAYLVGTVGAWADLTVTQVGTEEPGKAGEVCFEYAIRDSSGFDVGSAVIRGEALTDDTEENSADE
ncbi:hypothetical protein [Nocardia sp. alder85J]|uniref:hypothetical protein n=1 Tax=Nocardia sp. alder85J TaxID=2862949 RepID=UPI001CD6BD36|nr:hypothetical protein [Nocardia sp. alder85J]MCX4099125.1 hypothetical protein [Nocardia sp. alder85J]